MSPVCQRNPSILLTKVKHKRKPLDVYSAHSLALRSPDDGDCRGYQSCGECFGGYFYLHPLWLIANGHCGIRDGHTC